MNSGISVLVLTFLFTFALNFAARADALSDYCGTLLGAPVLHDEPDFTEALRDAEGVARGWLRALPEPPRNSVGRVLRMTVDSRASDGGDGRDLFAAVVAINGEPVRLVPTLSLRTELARSRSRLSRLRRRGEHVLVRFDHQAVGLAQVREVLARVGGVQDQGATLLARAYTVLDALVSAAPAAHADDEPFVHFATKRPLAPSEFARFGVDPEDVGDSSVSLTLDQVLYRDAHAGDVMLLGVTQVICE